MSLAAAGRAQTTAAGEVRHAIPVTADQAIVSIQIPAGEPLDETVARYPRLQIDAEQLERFDGRSYFFTRAIPAAGHEAAVAALAAEQPAEVRGSVTDRPSGTAIDAAVERMLPELVGRARAQAAAMLREAGYLPGSLRGLGLAASPPDLSGVVTVKVRVAMNAAGPASAADPPPLAVVEHAPAFPATDRFLVELRLQAKPGTTVDAVQALLGRAGLGSARLQRAGAVAHSANRLDSSLQFIMEAPGARLFAIAQALDRLADDPGGRVLRTSIAARRGPGSPPSGHDAFVAPRPVAAAAQAMARAAGYRVAGQRLGSRTLGFPVTVASFFLPGFVSDGLAATNRASEESWRWEFPLEAGDHPSN